MHALFNYYKNTLFAICYISLLTGCGTAYIATEKPFRDPIASITPGQTTRESVHALLGNPRRYSLFLWPSIDKGNLEVFGPKLHKAPCGDLDHYALIIYDATGRVDATDWKYTGSGFGRTTLYADGYGYTTGTRTIFPSKDGGGKADKAWARYLEIVQFRSSSWDKPIY